MTDNEIIKALECCIKDDIIQADGKTCRECPMNDDNACTFYLRKHTLDLINRQKAEIESLTNKYNLAVSEREANMCGFLEELNRYETERKELRAELEEKTKKLQEILPIVAELKAEAVKEFAERLKNKSKNRVSDIYGARVFIQDIDNLVKEMVGEG